MELPLLYEALQRFENFRESSDGLNVSLCCPFCGGSDEDTNSFSVKINPDPNEPIFYQCYRASCGVHGAIRTKTLEEMGITDMNVILEVSRHNQNVSPNFDSPFKEMEQKRIEITNLPVGNAPAKLAYINSRLGVRFDIQDLKDYKIQLNLLDMLRLNDIRELAVSKTKAKSLDVYCVGFVSMFSDYLICRDITPDMVTGKRYFSYQIAGRKKENATKIYSIPREIDLMDPHSAIINVAEGAFSILGAYLHSGIGMEKPNSIWLANCGSQFENTIMQVCKQFGLLKVHINIWSDSEIPFGSYKKLYRQLKSRLNIRKMTVYYNAASDDFGHRAKDIRIDKATIV